MPARKIPSELRVLQTPTKEESLLPHQWQMWLDSKHDLECAQSRNTVPLYAAHALALQSQEPFQLPAPRHAPDSSARHNQAGQNKAMPEDRFYFQLTFQYHDAKAQHVGLRGQ